MDGQFQNGWRHVTVSGSRIRVFVLGKLGLGWGGWEKYKSMMGDVWGIRGG